MPQVAEIPTKSLSMCTNYELLELLIPDLGERLEAARSSQNQLLKEISDRDMIEPGFRPFACFGGGFQ